MANAAKRIDCAIRGVRRAVDLILHGAAAELVNESFVENEREAWMVLGAAICEEIQDHGFEIHLIQDGGVYLVDEVDT